MPPISNPSQHTHATTPPSPAPNKASALRLHVNGEIRELADPTVAAAIASVGLEPTARHLAVAVNDAVVRRADWSSHTLHPDDRVEVITAVAGG